METGASHVLCMYLSLCGVISSNSGSLPSAPSSFCFHRSLDSNLFNKSNEIQEDLTQKRFELYVSSLHLAAVKSQVRFLITSVCMHQTAACIRKGGTCQWASFLLMSLHISSLTSESGSCTSHYLPNLILRFFTL